MIQFTLKNKKVIKLDVLPASFYWGNELLSMKSNYFLIKKQQNDKFILEVFSKTNYNIANITCPIKIKTGAC